MRAHLATLAGLLLAGSLLAGCGDDTDSPEAASDPTSSASPGDSPAASPTGKPVSVQKTCAELYHPPAQLMPRAIEFVHGSPSAEDATDAAEISTGLAEVEGHSLGPLAEDIAVARIAVDTQVSAVESGSEGPDLAEFDKAINTLARHCELYND